MASLNESKDNPYNNQNNYNTIETDKVTNSSASRYNKPSIIVEPQQKQMSFKTYILTNTKEIRKRNNLNNNNIKHGFPKNYRNNEEFNNYDSKNKRYFTSEDNQVKKSNNFIDIANLGNIKSPFILKKIFAFLNEKGKLDIIKYNKYYQKILSVDIEYYKKISGKYIIYEMNGRGKEYNKYNDLIFEGKMEKEMEK